jgi:thiol-disulfide isomerase/thioredoxin
MKNSNGQTAPEFEDLQGWINSEPLTLRGLRGRVIFLDFWTFGCINCINTRPYFNDMYDHFRNEPDFVMIGIHTPEFAYEKNPDDVRKAVLGHRIEYPVALDSQNTTWKLYGNHYWPRQAIVDASGKICYEHVGEGDYEEMNAKVSELLAEARLNGKPETRLVTGQ